MLAALKGRILFSGLCDPRCK